MKGFIKGFAMSTPTFLVAKEGMSRCIASNFKGSDIAAAACASMFVNTVVLKSCGMSALSWKGWTTAEKIGFKIGTISMTAAGIIAAGNQELAKR